MNDKVTKLGKCSECKVAYYRSIEEWVRYEYDYCPYCGKLSTWGREGTKPKAKADKSYELISIKGKCNGCGAKYHRELSNTSTKIVDTCKYCKRVCAWYPDRPDNKCKFYSMLYNHCMLVPEEKGFVKCNGGYNDKETCPLWGKRS